MIVVLVPVFFPCLTSFAESRLRVYRHYLYGLSYFIHLRSRLLISRCLISRH